ncbi:hypothetical protein SYK_21790 [Pseudodesulfovibrio nedwellii]|uniref:Peptidase U32 n=1 Tax=Pseudodesulfovibrio nedwellii TaxID=2973072 RepID=A0ABM8B1Z2_9BACT|nr:hypothetical protein [Pseudodesulfovibrio nedwellii]BDQ37819.1 hypothetical protein SYK_21790 [Pseudodesulfovibrio nedwellii]
MLSLDVPFVPDGDYPDFLARHAASLTSVHFSLYDQRLADSRHRMESPGLDKIISGLSALVDVDKYVLMNARLHAPGRYFGKTGLDETARRLEHILEKTDISGVIFADPYFLQALSDTHPDLAGSLEAIPSVNCMLDSPERLFAMIAMIDGTMFKPPSRIVPDRALNRNPLRLQEIVNAVRSLYPAMKIHLLANEGCLYQCPYKPAHDAHISLVNEGLCHERTFAMNRDLGCIRRLLQDPGLILASPFIRPEDIHRYEGQVDGIKLCGRTKGIIFLKRAITAYIDGSYTGNLLNLMDAMGDLANRINIPNKELPDQIFAQVSTCDKNCADCGWCHGVMQSISTQTDPALSRL